MVAALLLAHHVAKPQGRGLRSDCHGQISFFVFPEITREADGFQNNQDPDPEIAQRLRQLTSAERRALRLVRALTAFCLRENEKPSLSRRKMRAFANR